MSFRNIIIIGEMVEERKTYTAWRQHREYKVHLTDPLAFYHISKASRDELLLALLSPKGDERLLAQIRLKAWKDLDDNKDANSKI